VVGTGGDASGSYNVSTCAALIVAGCGVGRQARQPGAVVEIGRCRRARRTRREDRTPSDEITRCIYEAGIGFMFAPAHHPATKNVAPTRVELGTARSSTCSTDLQPPASNAR
jgi:anthranilate phosphoribosyltransferase